MALSFNAMLIMLYLYLFQTNCNRTLSCFGQLTSGGFVEETFDHGNKLQVLAEASVVKGIVAQAVHRLHVGAALQQHLHCVLAAVLAAQNQRRPDGGRNKTLFMRKNTHKPSVQQLCLNMRTSNHKTRGTKNYSLCM